MASKRSGRRTISQTRPRSKTPATGSPSPRSQRKATPVRRRPSPTPQEWQPAPVAPPTRRAAATPTADAPVATVAAESPADLASQQANDAAASPAWLQFPVVGVAASAGGIEAFSQLLDALPPDTGVAIVLILHLSPHRDSLLPDLLGGRVHIPVVQIADGVAIEPHHVYVAPPNAQVELREGRLRLTPRPGDSSQYTPADHFFYSLAESAQSRAIGVVLSGNAADGALGVREIKAVGGITLAQEPATAKFDGMPRAAIATGAVDLVLPPRELALELARISQHPLLRPPSPRSAEDAPSIDEQLPRIFTMLRNTSGVDFSHYKLPTIKRRLQRRMILHRLTSIDAYVKFMQKNPDEVTALYRDLLIQVTRFFREPESFQALFDLAFPAILSQRRGNDDPIRVWVPGCATGEEPYSIAIALFEALGDGAAGVPIQIFATDVSEVAIEHARAGVYPESISADVSAERLRRFFIRVDGNYRISKSVRDVCVFARQDLTRDPPFSRLDLIICRNVLIYLSVALQKRLMSVFHYALKPGGFLMLGAAETAGPTDLFSLVDKRHRLYSKRTAAVRADMSFPPLSPRPLEEPRSRAPVLRSATVQNEANRIILDRYSPPAVLVNRDLQITYFRGQTGPFLEPAPGEATLDLLKMARDGLLHGLRSAISEAQQRGEAVRRDGLRVKHNGHSLEVNIEVIPVEGPLEGRHFLVLFERPAADSRAPGRDRPRERAAASTSRRDYASQLEQELAASREYLQSIIQDLEAANEELQSANEEILSSNEELQSTNEELDTAKEELQSTNEELNTVNEELHNRNEELSRSNSDLINLLASVQIAIVMVTSDLRIRRYTPMAERVLNLIPGDVGRRISDIKPNIECGDLETLITAAIDGVVTVEREVRDRQGNTFALRIRPYKSIENRIEGAVLALFEMDAARSNERLDACGGHLTTALLALVREPVVLLDRELRIMEVNAAFQRLYDPERTARWRGQTLSQLDGAVHSWNAAEASRLLGEALAAQMPIEDLRLPPPADRPAAPAVRIDARPLPGPDGHAAAMLLRLQEEREPPPSH